MEKIRVADLSKSFETGADRLQVIDSISLSVEEGGFTTILGPSGCGKTTLLRIMAGIEAADGGESVILPVGTGAALSLVHQQNDLLPWLTAEDNIKVALKAKGLDGNEQSRLAASFLGKVSLGGFEAFYPGQLSGGMQKRASLARALASRSDIILCDEPLAFLDFNSKASLRDLVVELYRQQRSTYVYVTHDIYEAIILSRWIVVLSARPARVKAVIEIPFDYPRDVDDPKLSEEYRRIIAEIKEILREEVVKTEAMEKGRIMEGRRQGGSFRG